MIESYIIDYYIQQHKELKYRDDGKGLPTQDEFNLREYLHLVSIDYKQMFYTSHVWHQSRYKGLKILKIPNDLWIFQEIVWEIKPDVVIETGTYEGGSTLYFADLLNNVYHGEIISIDVDMNGNLPQHERISYINGSSLSEDVIERVKEKIDGKAVVMVDLDSDHNKYHVLKEMEIYGKFVTPGSYMIVEDSIIGGHPVNVLDGKGRVFSPGPYEAVDEFLKTNHDFVIDKSKERFDITTNPNGYLRKR